MLLTAKVAAGSRRFQVAAGCRRFLSAVHRNEPECKKYRILIALDGIVCQDNFS